MNGPAKIGLGLAFILVLWMSVLLEQHPATVVFHPAPSPYAVHDR